MEGQGDGPHNGRNRPVIALLFFPRGNRPPADQLNAELLAWMEFALIHEFDEPEFAVLVEPVRQRNVNVNNPDVNDDIHNDNVDDDTDDSDLDDVDNNCDGAEDADPGASAGTSAGVDLAAEDDTPLFGGSRKRPREEDKEDDEENSGKRFRWWEEFDEISSNGYYDSDSDSTQDGDNDNTDCDAVTAGKSLTVKHAGARATEEDPLPGPSGIRQSHKFAHSSSDTVAAGGGPNLAHSRSIIHPAEDAATVEKTDDGTCDSDKTTCDDDNTDKTAGRSSSKHPGTETAENGPLPGPPRKRSRKRRHINTTEDADTVERTDSTCDTHNDNNCDDNTDKTAGNGPVKPAGAEAAEEDPLPSPPRKRSRQCYEFADSSSDTVAIEGGPSLAHSSSNIHLPEDAATVEKTDSTCDSDKTTCDNNIDKTAGNSPVEHTGAGTETAVDDPLPGPPRKRSRKRHHIHPTEDAATEEKTDEEVKHPVEEVDARPGGSRKRSREDDDEGEDQRGGKRFKVCDED